MSSRVIHLKSEFTVQSVERIRRFDTFNGNVEKWRRILLIRDGYGIFDTRNKWCKCNEIEKEVATLVCKWRAGCLEARFIFFVGGANEASPWNKCHPSLNALTFEPSRYLNEFSKFFASFSKTFNFYPRPRW